MMASSVTDKELRGELVRHARNYRERAPVFGINQPVPEESLAQARDLALAIWNPTLACLLIPPVVGNYQTLIQLPNNGNVSVFHPSGAIAARMKAAQQRKPFGPEKEASDRTVLKARAQQVGEGIARRYLAPNEEVRYESFWELNGQVTTLKGEKSAPMLLEVVSSFRRYLHGLPVLGRASVHVGLGAGPQVTQWSVEWRRVRPEPFVETPIISAEEGAERVLTQMASLRPGKPFTSKDLKVQDFILGYMSFSPRVPQRVMQPVWVAVLAPLGKFNMGHVVAIPAAPQPFEPLARGPVIPMAPARSTPSN